MITNTRTFFAVAAIISMAAITGCAGKKSHTGIDNTGASATAAQTSAATPPITSTPAGSSETSSGVTGSGITDSSLSGDEASKQRGSAEGADTANSLKTVYFDFDAYLLSAEARETLTGNMRFLESDGQTQVTIEGHADERGSDEYNMALAEKRAVAVKRYLQSLGVSADRMETVSFGEDKPAVEGDNEAAWSKNRRVDFVIVK